MAGRRAGRGRGRFRHADRGRHLGTPVSRALAHGPVSRRDVTSCISIQYARRMPRIDRQQVHKGRGAVSNPAGRFEKTTSEVVDDGWGSTDESPPNPATQLIAEFPKHAITHNRSPDVAFDQSLNPYQGCEHGCIYCFARPAHAYLNLSPGLDFETRIFHKPNLAE